MTTIQVAKCPHCQKRVVRPEANFQAHINSCRPARLALGEYLKVERRRALINIQTSNFITR